jgi:hypothetical protein
MVKTEPKFNQTFYISHSVKIFHLSVAFLMFSEELRSWKSSITCHFLCMCICVCVCSRMLRPIFCILTALLLDIRFLYNVRTFRPINTDVLKYCNTFIFRVKQLTLSFLGLLGPVHKGCMSFQNIRNYLPADHNYYKNSELQDCIKKFGVYFLDWKITKMYSCCAE